VLKTLFNRGFEKLHRDKMYVAKATPQSDILEFLQKLAPVSTEIPLGRLGPAGDGGYLIPLDFEGILACVSPGVSVECGFDLAVAEKNIDVYMADASVDGPSQNHSRFHFVKKFIDTTTGRTTVTLQDFCESIPNYTSGLDFILQMDIEGAEYRVLLSTPEAVLRRFRVMVIEFHNLDNVLSRFSFQLIRATFQRLLEHFRVVHIHPNNAGRVVRRGTLDIPTLLEFTFLRKDYALTVLEKPIHFPHPLDLDNLSNKPHIVLPPCWQPHFIPDRK
jgi:hypothetical protein